MVLRKRTPRIRIRRWPTPDWYYANGLYRFIKTVFHHPVRWAVRMQVKGAQHVPREGGVLLAINHFSWADPVLVAASMDRPAFYLAKEKLFKNPITRVVFEGLGQIRVDRESGGNEAAIQTAVGGLQKGVLIGVFPEGTRSRYGELKRGKTGIARIAARSGAPVLPIAITTAELWPKHATMPKLGERVYVNIGEVMHLDLKPADAEDRQRMRDATDDVMERIRELLDEASKAKEGGIKWT